MGYVDIKVIFDCDHKRLEGQFEKHLALYTSRAVGAEEFEVAVCPGTHCAAIYSPRPQLRCPPGFLSPLGQQLAGIWMAVRYQDGDTWELSCYTGFEHELTHNVFPWPYDPEYKYSEDGVQYRINKLCKLLPQFADEIRPYLLMWRYPKNPQDETKLIERRGKARPGDEYEYGDAMQYLDFLKCFGIDPQKKSRTWTVRL